MGRLVALLAGCTTVMALVAVPTDQAAAHVEINGAILLPQTGSGDVVRLPGQPVLAVAGGDDSPVVFVDLVDRTVTVIPDTVGIRTLDLDEDGAHLHGVSRTPDEIVEIEVATAEVARRWPVPNACGLSDTVMRGGFLWVAQGCGDSGLRRLDPATGNLTGAAPGLAAGRLVGEPGTSRFYAFRSGTAPVLTHQDASPTGLVELDRREHDLSFVLSGDLHLSEDGGTLFVPNRDGFGGPQDTWAWNTADLSFSETWDVRLLPFWADAEHIGVELPQHGVPALVTRDDQTLVNTFLPDDVANMSTSDVRRVGDDLAIIGFAGGEKRAYTVDDPLVEEPQLTIETPWGSTGVNTPTPLTGTASSGGQPLAGQELQLIEVGPTNRVLATVVTNETGGWTHEWTPDDVGLHVLEIRYQGARDSVDRVRVAVEEIYERLDLRGPSVVDGGDDIVMTATVTRNGQPLPGITVDLERQDWAKPSYFEFEQLGSVTTNEAGDATFTTPPGVVDGYWYYAEALLPNEGRWRTDGHRVAVTRTPTTLTIEPEATTAVPGDPVPIHVSLTTGDGQPVQGEPVLLELRRESGVSRYATVTTDADGTATYVDTSPEEGSTRLRADFGGTLVLDDAEAFHPGLQRRRIATTVVVNGGTTGEVGVPVEVAGQVTGVDQPVELAIFDDHGTRASVMTNATGAWRTTITPTLPGPNYWRFAFEGTTRLAPSAATHRVETPRLATTIEVESVEAQVGQWLRVTGTFTGPTARSAIHFWLDDEFVGTRYADNGTFGTWLTELGPLKHAGPAQLVIRYDGDLRHEPASLVTPVEVQRGPSTLQLTQGPMVDPGDSFDVSGEVVPAVTGEVTFSVVDPAGDEAAVTVNVSDGHFVLPLAVPESAVSTAEWDVTFPGTDDYTPVTTTYRAQLRTSHQITLGLNPEQPLTGSIVDLYYQSPDNTPRAATFTVHDRFGTQLHSWDGTVGAIGRLLRVPIHTAWRVTLTLREDDQHVETTHALLVRPQPLLYNALPGAERNRRIYEYDEGEVPQLLSSVRPRDLRGCLTRVVQRRTEDRWRTVDRTCMRYSGERVRSRPKGVGRVGVSYRVRTEFDGNKWYPPSTSGFRYFRFVA